MAISAGGIGSGLDVNNLVGQLMALERQPLAALQRKEIELNNELSAYARVKGAISSFESAVTALSSADLFDKISASSSNKSAFTASADSTAAITSYDIEVLNLAQADKKYAAGATTYAGEQGVFDVTSGTNTFTITVDGTNNTLTGIRDAINNAAGNSTITASVITDINSNEQLILTAKDIGSANAITLGNASGASDIPTLLNFTSVAGFAQLDAQVKIDGFTVSSSSNTISNVIDGVTLNLVDTTTSAEKLTVSRDTQSIESKVSAMVNSYNDLVGTLNILGGKEGELSGDGVLLSIERSIQGVLNSSVAGGAYSYLSELGVTTQEDGKLQLDSSTLSTALTDNRADVSAFFTTASTGFAVRMGDVLSRISDSESGLIKGREDGIFAEVDRLKDRGKALELRLESVEKRYRAQFTALDTLISEMTNTGNYLAQQLASLPGASQS